MAGARLWTLMEILDGCARRMLFWQSGIDLRTVDAKMLLMVATELSDSQKMT